MKTQLIALLLEGIEEFRITSGTPEGKRIMIPSKILATYIAHRTLRVRNHHERDFTLIKQSKNRMNRLLAQSKAIRSGDSWVFTKEVITNLRKKLKLQEIKI